MNRKLALLLIPIIVLIGCCSVALVVMSGEPGQNEVYVQNMDLGNKYFKENNFEQAITYYTKAIEADKTQDEPYMFLAEIYYKQNNLNKAIHILRSGKKYARSDKLEEMLIRYLELSPESATEAGAGASSQTNSGNAVLNGTLLNTFSNNTYEDYLKEYTKVSDNYVSGKYTIKYNGLNAEFTYSNEGSVKIIDTGTHKPFNNASPSEIVVSDVDLIFPSLKSGVTMQQLQSAGAISVSNYYDSSLGKDVIKFTYGSCTVIVECNADKQITEESSYCVVKPVQKYREEKKTVVVSGKIISVTTGQNVANVQITVREGNNAKTTEAVTTATSADGNYSLTLEPGTYTIEISGEEYNTEYFTVVLNEEQTSVTQDFSISPKLATGEIRIVLEWGETPRDLDSHLTGTSSQGTSVHLFYANRVVNGSNGKIAELDIDDTSGYGPETTTLYDIGGTYTYTVNNFSHDAQLSASGATVKVYTAGQSQPRIYNVPSGVGVNWNVFKIQNGQITDLSPAG